MLNRTALLTTIALLLIASPAFCGEGLSTPRSNASGGTLPVTYVLRRQYQVTGKDASHNSTVTETKYKDVSGRTVSVANTVGNLTTHKDPDGRVIGYSIAANGKTLQYDAHGRAIKPVTQ